MGLLTLEEFRSDLNFALEERVESSSRLTRWINKAYFEAAVLTEFDGLRESATTSTVKDQQEYQLPSDFLAPISISLPDDDRILLETSVYAMRKRDPDVSGIPKYFMVRQTSLYLWPVPDEAGNTIQFDYIYEPDALSGDSDTTIFPKLYDQAIHWLAIRNAWLDLADSEKATFFYQTAVNYLNTVQSSAELGMESQKEGITIARSEADLHKMRTDGGL